MNTTQAIKELLLIVDKLREEYPYKRFNLDGRLVGDLGETIVAENYNIKLYTKQKERYDGETPDGKKVQIKATFHNTLGLPCSESKIPDFYIGIKIKNNGSFEEIYNGPGNKIWEKLKDRKPTKNSLHAISINTLREINNCISSKDRIKRIKTIVK